MATFRKVHTKFWSDPFIQNLSPEKKFFYLYLLTNESTRQCGIYEITKTRISFDTGYTIETVSILINYFVELGKIKFNETTNEIGIKNWVYYNDSKSPKVQSCVNEELKKVKDKEMIQYLYCIDTVQNQYGEEENKNKNKNKNKKEIQEVIAPKTGLINNLNRQPVIPSKDQVLEVFIRSGGTKEMAKSFYDKHEGTGWFINGSPITNFIPLANKFIDSWKRNEEKAKPVDSSKVKLNFK